MKIALFVAGDKNIFFPALVALDSINRQNPGIFDLFICFDDEDVTDDMRAAMRHHEVEFVSSKEIGGVSGIDRLPKMKEGRWPREILLNWALPDYLLAKGYEHSIKVDYDILCIAPYDMAEILPSSSEIVSGLTMAVDLEKEGVGKDLLTELEVSDAYRPSVKTYINAGFVAFNNRLCKSFGFFDRLLVVYGKILSHSPGANLAEQIAVAIVLSVAPGGIKELAPAYNHRVRWGILVNEHLIPEAKNIHYITGLKPWVPFDRKHVPYFVRNKQGVLFTYRALWLAKANESPWFGVYCQESPLTQEQILGINIIVCHCYNQRLRELEARIEALEAREMAER